MVSNVVVLVDISFKADPELDPDLQENWTLNLSKRGGGGVMPKLIVFANNSILTNLRVLILDMKIVLLNLQSYNTQMGYSQIKYSYFCTNI